MISRLLLASSLSVLCAGVAVQLRAQRGNQIGAQPPASTATTPAAAPRKTCTVIAAKPTDADQLLARKSYKEAETVFLAALMKNSADEEAQLGLVRSLVGEDKIADAQALAARMLAARPKSVLAEIASSEADYRAADVDSAFAHARAAVADDPCEGRAAVAIAAIYDLNALFAHSAALYGHAHLLRPSDELIRRDWIDSLPRDKRQAELARYLEGEHTLSADDTTDYSNELEHLKARKPGECRVVSKSETTTEKMMPVYGDNSRPEAFGLDVYFNGKRHRMQIDTGASGILLTQSAARDLKLDPEFHLKTGGVGDEGQRDSYLTHIHSIRIGDVEVSDCLVEVVQKSKLDVDGLIGMDVFRRWLVTLDYVNAQVRLAPLPARPGTPAGTKLESDPLPADVGDENDTPRDRYVAPEMKSWLPILRIGHNILLQTRMKDGPLHYLIMDTGASLTTLSLAFAHEAGKFHDASEIEFSGISGKVKKVYEVERVPLRVENIILPERGYYTFDLTSTSHDTGFEVSGFLGLPTLQRLTITIDYRDNLLKIEYDPKKDVQRF